MEDRAIARQELSSILYPLSSIPSGPQIELLFLDRDFLHGIALADGVHHILALDHLAEYGMPAVEVRLG